VVLTGSHEEMTAIGENPERLTQWMNENYRFVSERFGGRNVVDFTLHMDERTPHIHCVVVPLTVDGRLSAKEVMGDRRKLSELQDCYGKVMQNKFGLQRGIKGSTATHDSVREYYGRIEERLIYPSNSMELNYETRAPQIGTPPLIGREKWAEKQNKTIYEDFTQMREHYKHEAEKQSQKVLKYFQNSKLQAEEKADRLRKENAQLRGVIEEQHKKLHPERYIKHNKGYSL
ncbi:MobV family relaxase, partial [Phocaeicola vulgatus]